MRSTTAAASVSSRERRRRRSSSTARTSSAVRIWAGPPAAIGRGVLGEEKRRLITTISAAAGSIAQRHAREPILSRICLIADRILPGIRGGSRCGSRPGSRRGRPCSAWYPESACSSSRWPSRSQPRGLSSRPAWMPSCRPRSKPARIRRRLLRQHRGRGVVPLLRATGGRHGCVEAIEGGGVPVPLGARDEAVAVHVDAPELVARVTARCRSLPRGSARRRGWRRAR